jgi:hypothetical protein
MEHKGWGIALIIIGLIIVAYVGMSSVEYKREFYQSGINSKATTSSSISGFDTEGFLIKGSLGILLTIFGATLLKNTSRKTEEVKNQKPVLNS